MTDLSHLRNGLATRRHRPSERAARGLASGPGGGGGETILGSTGGGADGRVLLFSGLWSCSAGNGATFYSH
jgi:hypothetical protein